MVKLLSDVTYASKTKRHGNLVRYVVALSYLVLKGGSMVDQLQEFMVDPTSNLTKVARVSKVCKSKSLEQF